MSFWRKRPVVIEAFLWTGGPDQEEDPEWAVDAVRNGHIKFRGDSNPDGAGTLWMEIATLEGTHRANVGDWIIRGVKGELYPCKPDVFTLTYEKVEEV